MVVQRTLLSWVLAVAPGVAGCATVRPAPVEEPFPLAFGPSPSSASPPSGHAAPAFAIPARPVAGADGLIALCQQLRDEDGVSFPGTDVERATAREAHRGRRVEAANGRYVADVAPDGFTFRGYDDGRLTLDLARGVTLGEGAQLYATGDDASAMAFSLPADAADRIEREHAGGRLRLALVFRAARSPVRGDLCLRQGGGQIVKMTVEPLAAYLIGADGRALARSDIDEFADVVAAGNAVTSPDVKIGKPSRDDRGELPEPVAAAAGRLGPDLLPCYRASLARKPELRGTLVVGAALAPDGRLASPKMEVSSVADDALVSCVLDRVGRARLAAAPNPMRVSIPIRFGDAEATGRR